MLEKACILVENTAKGGGVYPEVLFQVAKYWYELFLRVRIVTLSSIAQEKQNLYFNITNFLQNLGGDQLDDIPHDSMQLDPNAPLLVDAGPSVDLTTAQLMSVPPPTVVVTSTPPPPYPPRATITTLAPLGNREILSF